MEGGLLVWQAPWLETGPKDPVNEQQDRQPVSPTLGEEALGAAGSPKSSSSTC